MNDQGVSFEQIVKLVKQLSPVEKIQLIERVAPALEAPLKTATVTKNSLLSAYGALADLGTAPSADEIDEIRKEVYSSLQNGGK